MSRDGFGHHWRLVAAQEPCLWRFLAWAVQWPGTLGHLFLIFLITKSLQNGFAHLPFQQVAGQVFQISVSLCHPGVWLSRWVREQSYSLAGRTLKPNTPKTIAEWSRARPEPGHAAVH